MLKPSLGRNLELVKEKCPNCGSRFASRPCCDRPDHNIGTACGRCGQVFLSASAPSLDLTAERPPPARRPAKEASPRHRPTSRPRTGRGFGGVKV